MPSIKLFKRMTTLKREKTEVENELAYIREKLEDATFMNQKLDEALRV